MSEVVVGNVASPLGTTDTLSGVITFGSGSNAATLVGPGGFITTGTATAADLGATTADILLTGSALLRNTGLLNDAGVIEFSGAGAIDNAASGTFNMSGIDSAIDVGSYGSGTLTNEGLLEKTSSTATSHIQAYLINTGTVDVTAGTLEFDGSGLLGGTFETSGAGVIAFGGGNAYGAGSYGVYGSAATIGGNVIVANATLAPATGSTLTLSGADTFGSGSGAAILKGPGNLINAGTATAADVGATTADVLLTGSALWRNTGLLNDVGVIEFGGAGAIDNAASGTFDMSGIDSAVDVGSYGSGTLTNEGLLEKTSSTATSHIQAFLINTGTIDVTAGTLEFDGSGLLDGTLETSGAGIVAFGGGNAYGAGSYGVCGSAAAIGGNVIMANATLAPATGSTLTLSGTDTFGSGSNAATLNGPGNVITAGTATVADLGTSTAAALLTGSVLWRNTGLLNDAGVIDFSGAGLIDNAASHKFVMTGTDSAIDVGAYGSGTFTNEGLLEKIDSSATNHVQAYLINSGTIYVTTGKLELDGGGLLGGIFKTSGSGVLLLGGGATFKTSATNARIAGNVIVANATLLPTTGSTFTLSGIDTFGSSSGAAVLSGPGAIVTAGTATAANLGATTADVLLTGSVLLRDTGLLNDAGVIEFGGAGAIDNAASGTFDMSGIDSAVDVGSYGSGTLTNEGLLEKTASTATSHIQAFLINTGSIDVTAGTLELDGSGLLGGTFETSGAGVIAFGGGNAYGAGSYGVYGSAATIGGNVIVANATLAPATGSTLILSGTDTFGSGSGAAILKGPGNLITAGTATAADLGATKADVLLTGSALLRNIGLLNDAGVIEFGGAGAIDNAASGTFDMSGIDSAVDVGSYGSGTLTNEGLLEKTSSTATSHIQAFLINTGTIDVTAGTLEFDGSGLLDGTFETSGAGIVAFGGGNAYGAGSYGVCGSAAAIGGNVIMANATLAPATGSTLTLSGTDTFGSGSNAATLNGPGNVITAGTATVADLGTSTAALLTGSALWRNTGLLNDAGVIDFSGAGLIDNAASGTFNMTGTDSAIDVGSYGSGTFLNEGVLELSEAGSSQIQATLINSGAIELSGGTFNASSLNLIAGATLSGFGTVQNAIANAGKVEASNGDLDITGSISGTGQLVIGGSSTLELGGTVSEAVSFGGASSVLKLDAPNSFSSTLSGLASSDVIDIASTTVSSATLSGASLLITLTGGKQLDYALATALTGDSLTIHSDNQVGSDITLVGHTSSASPKIAFIAGGNSIQQAGSSIASAPLLVREIASLGHAQLADMFKDPKQYSSTLSISEIGSSVEPTLPMSAIFPGATLNLASNASHAAGSLHWDRLHFLT